MQEIFSIVNTAMNRKYPVLGFHIHGLVFKILLLVGILWTSKPSISAQNILVSREVSIRNDQAYEIITGVKGKVMLYRDKGNELVMDIFSDDLKFEKTINLPFPKRKISVDGITEGPDFINFYYSYQEKTSIFLKMIRLNEEGILIDSMTIHEIEKPKAYTTFRYTQSEDGKKTLLFRVENDKLQTFVIDNPTLKIERKNEVTVIDFTLREDFKAVLISNEGTIFFLFEHADRGRSGRTSFYTIMKSTTPLDFVTYRVDGLNLVNSGLKFQYDNLNHRIILAGFGGKENETRMEGYFILNKKTEELHSENVIRYTLFDDLFLFDVYGKNVQKDPVLRDYSVTDLVIRQDGGVILVAEMSKEVTRRSAMATGIPVYDGDRFAVRSFTDYYNEDVILIATYPDGSDHWKRILYKRQFSQDDEAIFSSYFIFKTPSRMRIVYNDEIKNNNTVGEYILDPTGNYGRRTILNTDYLNLKLRLTAAQQINNHQIIVPSEKNYKLNLVKINL